MIMGEAAKYNLEYMDSLIGCLGITFQPSEIGLVRASMPVDSRTCQPYGYLSGGAALALAESMAGHGSRLLCQEDQFPRGVQVSGNHLTAVPKGGVVTGVGKILRQGKTLHLWSIDVFSEGVKASTVKVVNYIVSKNKKVSD